jgi:hypothetical protein
MANRAAAEASVTLRCTGGTAMRKLALDLAIFTLGIQLEPLCCAAFES